jgi:hypothetical protein
LEAAGSPVVRLELTDVGGSNVSQLLIYQVAREALNNAARHSRANRITVRLFRESGLIRLIVEDDGVGFDASQVDMNTSVCSSWLSGSKPVADVWSSTRNLEEALESWPRCLRRFEGLREDRNRSSTPDKPKGPFGAPRQSRDCSLRAAKFTPSSGRHPRERRREERLAR